MNYKFDWRTVITDDKELNVNIKDIWKKSRKFVKWFMIVLVAAFLIVNIVDIYMQIIQRAEIGGFDQVFYTDIKYRVLTVAITGSLTFISVFITNFFVKKGVKNILKKLGIVEIGSKKLPNLLIAAIGAVLTVIFTNNSLYKQLMFCINSTAFGVDTPVVGGDVGYFIFQRPFLIAVLGYLTGFLILLMIYTFIYYFVAINVKVDTIRLKDFKQPFIVKQFAIMAAVLIGILAYRFSFSYSGLVYSSFYGVTGAGYTDVTIWKLFYMIAPYVLAVSALSILIFAFKKKYKTAIWSLGLLPAVTIVFAVIAVITQQFIVKPNEPLYESRYLKNNMAMTRNAFDIDKAQAKSFTQSADFDKTTLDRNQGTKDNIRVVDFESTLKSNRQLQSNTNFYTFINGDIINFNIDGKNTPVFITAREITKNKIQGNESYINQKFKYTHGYGLVVNPINKLSSQGQIEFLLSGLKMDNSDINNLKVTQPRIYYGELTNDYVIVNPDSSNKEKEIDMDGTVTTSYSGEGGIKLGFFNKLLFALKEKDFNMLVSGNVDSNSTIMINRNIIQRAQMALPFLTIDHNAYMVISNEGRLKWVIDGYTTSKNYPYANTFDGVNYQRNSVKISIDAYDGKLEAYVIDNDDPIIQTYEKIYPGVLKTGPLPEYISTHMRYPESFFITQTKVLQRYHLNPQLDTDVTKFYENQDYWDIAKLPSHTSENKNMTNNSFTDIEPYYNMIKLPGSKDKEEMIIMRAFTPSSQRHNMVAWCAARNEYDHYGELILYTFPRNTNILGPDQVEVNINQIPEITQDKALWGQNGSKVYNGNLLVIPIENNILYIQPIYIQADSESSIPQVKRIVVGFQKGTGLEYGYGETLDGALNSLFSKTTNGSNKPQPTVQPGESPLSNTTQPPAEANLNRDELKKKIKEKLDSIDKQSKEVRDLLEQIN